MTGTPNFELTVSQRRVMVQYIYESMSGNDKYEVWATLRTARSSDILAYMAVSNMFGVGKNPHTSARKMLIEHDYSMLRIMAEHEHLVTEDRVLSANDLYSILNGLKSAGIIDDRTCSLPSVPKHVSVSARFLMSDVPYDEDIQLMVFVEENIHRADEIIRYIDENDVRDVGVLRSHFYNEAAALHEGTL